MTPAQRSALIVAAKRRAIPVVSCVRADLRFGHLTDGLSREGLLALVTVLAECADPVKLKAVTEAPGDAGMPPLSREDVLRHAHAERVRLERAGLPVPYRVRALAAEYRRGVNARYRANRKDREDAARHAGERGSEAA